MVLKNGGSHGIAGTAGTASTFYGARRRRAASNLATTGWNYGKTKDQIFISPTQHSVDIICYSVPLFT